MSGSQASGEAFETFAKEVTQRESPAHSGFKCGEVLNPLYAYGVVGVELALFAADRYVNTVPAASGRRPYGLRLYAVRESQPGLGPVRSPSLMDTCALLALTGTSVKSVYIYI